MIRIIAISLAAVASLGIGCPAGTQNTQTANKETIPPSPASQEASRSSPTSQGASTQPISKELQERINRLISQLKWSQSVGPAHMPFLQIHGNDSARKLVKIGKPAVPSLVKALTQVKRTSPLLTKKHVATVIILGKIGDKSAVPGILDALKRNQRDIYFIQAAVCALGELGDPRAIPQLKSLAALSFQVQAAMKAIDPNTGLATEKTPGNVRWWVEKGGIGAVSMQLQGMDCYKAIARLDPKTGFTLSSRSLNSPNEVERSAAVMGLERAGKDDKAYRYQAMELLRRRQKVEMDNLVQGLIESVLSEMKKIPTSGPVKPTQSSPATK